MVKRSRPSLSRRCIFWIAASVVVAVLFFCFSSQDALDSNEFSKGFLRRLLTLLLGAPPETLPRSFNHFIRKAAHFTIYALLGFCLTGFYHSLRRVPTLSAAVVTAALYAVTDELHQRFVPGRGPQLTDVLLDACGATLGALIMLLILRVLPKARRRAG